MAQKLDTVSRLITHSNQGPESDTFIVGQGARNPSEWDITDLIESGEENTLAVRVYQFTGL
jgi:hypothetical protein